MIQQLREAFPGDTLLRHLLFDRDSIFSTQVVSTVKSFGIKPSRTAWKSPWQNGVAERWVGSVRRANCSIMSSCSATATSGDFYASTSPYHHDDRTHLGLGKATPGGRPVERRPRGEAVVVARPRVGGLHHRYEWRAAA